MSEAVSTLRRASDSGVMAVLARSGLAARAFIYLVIGLLAIQIALGHNRHEADQRGALTAVAHYCYGDLLLWVIAFGFAAYSLWRLSEAAFGTATDGRKAGPRLQSLARGLIYAFFAFSTFGFILGTSPQAQKDQQRSLTAQVMSHDLGRWLVGLVGAIVVIAGLGMIIEGLTRKFEKQLHREEMTPRVSRAVTGLGMVGTTARGIVFALAGALVVDAAITYDADKSSGLDGALRTLADRPYGPVLLGLVAFGLVVFGIYGFAAARYAKI